MKVLSFQDPNDEEKQVIRVTTVRLKKTCSLRDLELLSLLSCAFDLG